MLKKILYRAKILWIVSGVLIITGFAAAGLICFGLPAIFQREKRFSNLPKRASIVDRQGAILARTDAVQALWFNPRFSKNKLYKSPRQIAEELAEVFPNFVVDNLAGRLASGQPGYLKRVITYDEAKYVRDIDELALQTPWESIRSYPKGALAAHILGFVSDERGRDGIEAAMDGRLTNPAKLNVALELSISLPIQAILEEELASGIAISAAQGAAGIVLDVDTGEVLALASLPSFDPNAVGKADRAALINRATVPVYEFGSTLMPITAAAAIDAGSAGDLSRCYSTRPFAIGDFEISDRHSAAPSLSLPGALMQSSNVVMARIGSEVGDERMQQTLRSLGMDQRVPIELPGRATSLWPTVWSRSTTMTVSYGYGIAVTPLHLASAYAAMVNGGIWRPATLVKIDARRPVQGRRVFKISTSQRMRELLRLAVVSGTGKEADVAGLRVGGKTGSAEKFGRDGYRRNSLITSIVAAFPMDRPRYVVLVVLDEPRAKAGNSHQRSAAWNAAPIAGRVIERLSSIVGVPADPSREINLSELDQSHCSGNVARRGRS